MTGDRLKKHAKSISQYPRRIIKSLAKRFSESKRTTIRNAPPGETNSSSAAGEYHLLQNSPADPDHHQDQIRNDSVVEAAPGSHQKAPVPAIVRFDEDALEWNTDPRAPYVQSIIRFMAKSMRIVNGTLEKERHVDVKDAAGLIASRSLIIGQHDQTHALSSVNGFAIHAEGTAGVSAVYPVEFNVKATSTVQAPLYELDIGYENCCVAVKRGAPIPKAITAVDRYNGENGSLFDAVIPDDEAQENILQRSDGQTVLRVPFRVIEGANVFRPQYDRRNGGVQITRGEFIQEDLTNAASLADSKIWVLKKPSVAIVFSWSAVTDRFSETRVRHPYLSDMTKLVTQLTSLKMLEGLGINFDIFFHPREAFIKTDLQREMNTHDIVVYIDYDHQNVSSPAGARAITALGGKICLRYYLGKFEKGALLGVGRNKQLAQIAVFWINGDNNAVNVAMRELVQPFIRAYLGRPARFLASMGDGRDPGCDETSSPSDKGLEEDNMGGKDSIGKNGTADAAEKYIAVDVMDR